MKLINIILILFYISYNSSLSYKLIAKSLNSLKSLKSLNSLKSLKSFHVSCLKNDDDNNNNDNDNDNIENDIITEFKEKLNIEQKLAVFAPLEHVRVMAGPGSGKTRVLVNRIAYLILEENIRPTSILAVTFTKKTANEIKDRITNSLNCTGLTATTIHSFSVRILRIYSKKKDFTIYDDSESKKLIKNIVEDYEKENEIKCIYTIHEIYSTISFLKRTLGNNLRDKEYVIPFQNPSDLQILSLKLLLIYDDNLRQNNAKDFDDLIIDTYNLLKNDENVRNSIKKKYKHILVDEWQDVDHFQYLLINEIIKDEYDDNDNDIKRTLFVVGDPQQTIYSWRGSNPYNMEIFAENFKCLTFKLRENYRSVPPIIRASRSLMKNIAGTDWNTIQGRGVEIMKKSESNKDKLAVTVVNAYDDAKQAEFIAQSIGYQLRNKEFSGKEIAVLYRRHSQSLPIQAALLLQKIGFVTVGNINWIDSKEVKDILAYLRVLANPYDKLSLQRILNFPPRGIGPMAQTAFFDAADLVEEENIIDNAESLYDGLVTEPILQLLIQITNDNETDKKLEKKKSIKKTTDLILSDDNNNNNNNNNSNNDITETFKLPEVTDIRKYLKPEVVKKLRSASILFSELTDMLRVWEGDMSEFIEVLYSMTGLKEHLKSQKLDEKEKERRLNLFNVLLGLARSFDSYTDTDDLINQGSFGARTRLQNFLDYFLMDINDNEEVGSEEGQVRNIPNDHSNHVKLMSLHTAKGLEFDCVYIIGLENGLLPSSMDSSIFNRKSKSKKNDITKTITNEKENSEMNSEFEEERRLLYVGMTRARKKLILTYRNRVTIGNKSIPVQPSVFLKDIDDDVLFFKY